MESVLKEAGSCGRYQFLHILFTQLPRFVCAFSMYFMMFGGYDPGWRCVEIVHSNTVPPVTVEVATDSLALINHSLISSSYPSQARDNSNYNYSRNVGIVTSDLVGNISDSPGNTADTYNGTCDMAPSCNRLEFNPESRTIVSEFQLVCDRSWLLRNILLVQGVGYFLGPLVAGQIGERFGRKLSLYSCNAIICISSGVAIFSTHWGMFAACYFFIGAAGNSIIGISTVYTMEFLSTKWRGYYGSIPVPNIAVCLFALVTILLKDWTHVHIITFGLSLVTFAGVFIVPESPRWLIMNGYVKKAEDSVLRIAKVNGKKDIDEECFVHFRQITELEEKRNKSYTFLDIFRQRKLAIFTLKFAVIFMVFSTTYMSVAFGIRSLPGDYFINAIEASCVEIVFVILIGPLCNILGRRYSGCLCGTVGVISCLTIALSLSFLEEGYTRTRMVNIFAYVAKSSSQAMSIVASLLSNELFPTVVRNVSAGLLRCCAGIGGLVMPFLTPTGEVHSLTICFSVMCVLYALTAVLFPSFPETNRCNLNDSLKQTEIVVVEEYDNDNRQNNNDDNDVNDVNECLANEDEM